MLQEGTASVIYGNVFSLEKYEKKKRKLCPNANTTLHGSGLASSEVEKKKFSIVYSVEKLKQILILSLLKNYPV